MQPLSGVADMKNRFLVGILLIATVLVVAGVVFVLVFQHGPDKAAAGARLTTPQDIGARVGENAELKPASFQSSMADHEAIAKARDFVRQRMFLPNPETLPVGATIATFTGEQQGPKGFVKDLNVRVVVFHDYPQRLTGNVTGKIRQIDSRLTIVMNDQTAEVVYVLHTSAVG